MKELLFIAHRLPYPPDKGERVRAFHEILELAKEFRLTVAAPIGRPAELAQADALRGYCADVLTAPVGRAKWLLGLAKHMQGGSNTEAHFNVPALTALLRRRAAKKPFDIVIAYSSAVVPTALAMPAAVHLADLVDADSAKWRAYAETSGPLKRWFYRREADGVAALERAAVEACQATFVVSEAEAAALPVRNDRVHVLANGVDLEYFHPAPEPASGVPSLAFTGQMDYAPNVQGVCWFVEHVWPQLKANRPGLKFVIIGRDPTAAVRRLAAIDGIVVTGSVADVRPYVRRAAAVVVPLRIAPGISNKVLEAMAMGKCIIASPAALTGLDVEVGRDLLQADTSPQWLAALEQTLADPSLRSRLGLAARARAESSYRWSARLWPLVQVCRQFG